MSVLLIIAGWYSKSAGSGTSLLEKALREKEFFVGLSFAYAPLVGFLLDFSKNLRQDCDLKLHLLILTKPYLLKSAKKKLSEPMPQGAFSNVQFYSRESLGKVPSLASKITTFAAPKFLERHKRWFSNK